MPGATRPDITGANEELVARHFRVCRVVPQGAKKQRRHAQQHGYSLMGPGYGGLQAIDSEPPTARPYPVAEIQPASAPVTPTANGTVSTADSASARTRPPLLLRSASTTATATAPIAIAGPGQNPRSFSRKPGVARSTVSASRAAPMTPAA